MFFLPVACHLTPNPQHLHPNLPLQLTPAQPFRVQKVNRSLVCQQKVEVVGRGSWLGEFINSHTLLVFKVIQFIDPVALLLKLLLQITGY